MHALSLLPLLLPALIASHGLILSPAPRTVTDASLDACGRAITTAITKDNTSYVEQLTPLAAQPGSGYNASACNLALCKGLQYAPTVTLADGEPTVPLYTPGTVLPMKVWIRIPHAGIANVSVVDTKTNEAIAVLKSWDVYAAGKVGSLPKDNEEFEVTVPDTACRCAFEGQCVVQWWWFGTQVRQTYASCVDFRSVAEGVRCERPME
ncbi:hypothetical protein M501DRAFT_936869 [Patellaria atrata CBS 101060]|uniref:Chitin-binding type-4 domain-containing protein n=1 Tax=Patellaria atrata CBS 101060 TaxID=1346257 RepID=A0A9P4VRS5_9PEZI|nr:hypothetical protein M501DRAFT_936869 [Patellaria atrata CBS 101060]